MKLNLKLHTIILTTSLAFAVQATVAAPGPVQTVNKIAAVAGKDVITVREWNDSVNSARALLPKGSLTPPPDSMMRKL